MRAIKRSVAIATVAMAVAADGAAARQAPAGGTVLGGETSQGWPVVVVLNRAGDRVNRVSAGLELACTTGLSLRLPDRYRDLELTRTGAFSVVFGPIVQRTADGTTIDVEINLRGKLNKLRTKASGTWQFKMTVRDAAGVVVDTCDSGAVSWSAKN